MNHWIKLSYTYTVDNQDCRSSERFTLHKTKFGDYYWKNKNGESIPAFPTVEEATNYLYASLSKGMEQYNVRDIKVEAISKSLSVE